MAVEGAKGPPPLLGFPGSVMATFPREGYEKYWVKTVKGEGWFTYFRFYAPTQPYFEGTWQLPDIVKVK